MALVLANILSYSKHLQRGIIALILNTSLYSDLGTV